MKPSDIQTPSMDNRSRIRDTSGQDHVVSTPAGSFRRHRKAWLVGGIAGAVVLAMAAWVVVGWTSGGRSDDASRVRSEIGSGACRASGWQKREISVVGGSLQKNNQ